MKGSNTRIAVVGDTHGHLQLALCVAARWQSELRIALEAVFLCGDVGTFTEDAQLDSTTRRHGKANPCELEFLTQWSTSPQAPWLDDIFSPRQDGGLGLTCPVIMVHGNHEGFAHLAQLVPEKLPDEPVQAADLPRVDTNAHIRLLPSGWRVVLPSGAVVAGIGGIEEGQRYAKYYEMAYVDSDAMLHLMDKRVDVLITHQGPSGIQARGGSENLQVFLDYEIARVWFHGHSIIRSEVADAGPNRKTTVVPLGDIAFPGRGPCADEPGRDGWCIASLNGDHLDLRRTVPPFLREYRRNKWQKMENGLLICPALAKRGWPRRHGKA